MARRVILLIIRVDDCCCFLATATDDTTAADDDWALVDIPILYVQLLCIVRVVSEEEEGSKEGEFVG
jgi:hypothetical protein